MACEQVIIEQVATHEPLVPHPVMKPWLWLIWLPCLTAPSLGASAVSADPVPRLTLDAAVAHALRHNPDLAAARWGVEQARGRLMQAGRLGPPELGSEFKPNVAGREGTLSVGLSQRFPAASRLRAERAVSRSELAAAEAEILDAERRVTQEVGLLGVEGLALMAQQELKVRQITNSRELAEAARRSARVGEASELDATQFELETRQLELERLRLTAQIAENLAALRSWLGWPDAAELQLEGTLADPIVLPEAGQEPARRPDYRAAMARSEAAHEGVSLARASRWEELEVGVFGEVDRREDAPLGLEDERMVGIRVSVPLPIWGRFRGRIHEASAGAARAEKEAEALVVRMRAEAEVARVRMEVAARQAVEIDQDLLPRAADLERRLRGAHQQGQASVTDVLRARERRLGLESTALSLRRDFHLARIRYTAAMGDPRSGETAAIPGGRTAPTMAVTRPRPRRRRRLRERRRDLIRTGTTTEGEGWMDEAHFKPGVNRLPSGTRGPLRPFDLSAKESWVGWRALALALGLGLAFAWCSPRGHAAEAPPSEPPVVLDASTIQNLRLETVTARKQVFEETVFALGRIRVAPGHQAFVSSRVPGRAIRVDAHIDSRVEKGAELVVVESRLPGEPPPSVTLKAPMSGWIAAVNLALGQPVSPDAALIEIVDLEEIHAVAAVPEHRVGRLKIGNRARLRVSALPGREFEAELAHFAAEADAVSGTLDAAFHVANPDHALRPGMRAEFSIVVHSRPEVLAIPREAIQGELGNRSVFIRDPKGTNAFVRVAVVLGAENDRQVEVVKGLNEGDDVVARGAYSLAFAGRGAVSLKASLDAAHGHAHNEDGSEKDDHDHAASGNEAEGDHDHEHEDDHDHDHEQGEAAGHGTGVMSIASGSWTLFFATTSALLLVLLILSVMRQRSKSDANDGAGVRTAGGEGDDDPQQGGRHA